MGDQVKSKLRVLGGQGNYGIAASCHVSMSCSLALFRALVVPNAAKVTPADFDGSSPVVLAQIDSTEQIGKIFGVSKIRNGTRLGSWSASKMDLVFQPREASGQLRAWWTMHQTKNSEGISCWVRGKARNQPSRKLQGQESWL